MTISNVATYEAIAEESYQEMVQLIKSHRRPKPDGSEGYVVRLDPSQRSFKKAMISTVFTGMWLEALMHILIVKRFDENKFREYDRKVYEDKLCLLGVRDEAFIEDVKEFRLTRKTLIHEKAFFDDGEVKTAQAEAERASKLRQRIRALLLEGDGQQETDPDKPDI